MGDTLGGASESARRRSLRLGSSSSEKVCVQPESRERGRRPTGKEADLDARHDILSLLEHAKDRVLARDLFPDERDGEKQVLNLLSCLKQVLVDLEGLEEIYCYDQSGMRVDGQRKTDFMEKSDLQPKGSEVAFASNHIVLKKGKRLSQSKQIGWNGMQPASSARSSVSVCVL